MINEYVCVDIETTGCKPMENKIIEIGAVKVKDGKIVDTFSRLIDPECNIPYYITNLTGITNDMVKGQETIDIVLKDFIDFAEGDVIMGHNIMFDYSFLKCNAMVYNYKLEKRGIDTLKIARKTMPELESKALDYLCRYFGILDENHHRAFNDAAVTVELYNNLCGKFGAEYKEVFEPQPLVCKIKKIQPATAKQIKYLKDLMAYHGIEEQIEYDKLSKNEASKKIDKIISKKGRIFGFENK